MSSHDNAGEPNLHENWDHEHERRDVNTRSINRWMLYLAVVVLGSAFFVVWLFNQYEEMAVQRDVANPPDAETGTLPPLPRLQANPVLNMRALREHEDSVLSSYGAADRGLGTVRIPIDSAIAIVVREGKVPTMPSVPSSSDTVAAGRTNGSAQGTTNESAQTTGQQRGGA